MISDRHPETFDQLPLYFLPWIDDGGRGIDLWLEDQEPPVHISRDQDGSWSQAGAAGQEVPR